MPVRHYRGWMNKTQERKKKKEKCTNITDSKSSTQPWIYNIISVLLSFIMIVGQKVELA